MYAYRYDQLNRLTAMNTYRANSAGSNNNTLIEPDEALDEYNERIKYDANGNILGYFRNGATAVHGLAMDSLTYKYDYYTSGGTRKTYVPGGAVPSDAVRLTNRLNHVRDSITSGYTEDIDDQNVNNYTYDKIGNLTSDAKENISVIDWTVYGKISHIHKTDGTDIDYTYDAAGNRISKAVSKTVSGTPIIKTTYYVRDASGNVMSIYESGETAINGGDLTQTEIHLYGSSRIGVYNVNTNVQCIAASEEITTFIRGNKFFELSNHLGNVLATVSDRKIAIDNDNDGTVDYYTADVITANDYYSFGMGMVGRKFSATNTYRYSINGQEREIELNENTTSAEYWEYDSRIGRRWNRDPRPVTGISPYATFLNSPIYFNDPLGDTCINGETYEANSFKNASVLSNVVVKSVKKKENVAQENVPSFSFGNFGNELWEGTKDITGKIVDATIESGKDVVVAVLSAGNAFATDNVGGVGRQKSNAFADHPISQKVGERVGDGLAVIWGGIETLGGGLLTIGGGVSFIIPGVGEVTGPVVTGIGLAGVAHGTTVTIPTAWDNLTKIEETNDEVHETPPQNPEAPLVESPSSIEKANDSYLKDNGIDAHALKKEWLGEKAPIAQYDIYREKGSGELIIYKKGGKGDGIRTGEYIK